MEKKKEEKEGKIKPIRVDRYYVVYEENLLKPVCLHYHFKEAHFAFAYVSENMPDKRTFIVTGEELMLYGITELPSITAHRKAKIRKVQFETQHEYYFSPYLPKQRRKTLRTIYRRRNRRNLLRLINDKRNNPDN